MLVCLVTKVSYSGSGFGGLVDTYPVRSWDVSLLLSFDILNARHYSAVAYLFWCGLLLNDVSSVSTGPLETIDKARMHIIVGLKHWASAVVPVDDLCMIERRKNVRS